MDSNKLNQATFGAGCFWCIDAVFREVPGVESVKAGYSGGHVKNPAYREVCTGRTGHAEVIRVEYDSEKVDYATLLEVFLKVHDPTTLNRQGADVGTQYRSVIFYHNDEQEYIAKKAIIAANESGVWKDEVKTEVSPLENFYEAGSDHQDYYNSNEGAPYCQAVIKPKMDRFRDEFAELLKTEETT